MYTAEFDEIYDVTRFEGDVGHRLIIDAGRGCWRYFQTSSSGELLITETHGHNKDLLRLIGLFIQSSMEGETTYEKLDN